MVYSSKSRPCDGVCTLEHLVCGCPCLRSLRTQQLLKDALQARGKSDTPPPEEEATLHGYWDWHATPSCCSHVQFSPYLLGEGEDFWVGVLNLHMFCSSLVLDMVVAAVGGRAL